jgi:hypothetical protein
VAWEEFSKMIKVQKITAKQRGRTENERSAKSAKSRSLRNENDL